MEKQDTWSQKALQPHLKVAVQYLATGNSYHSLMYNFQVAHDTISSIVRDICQAIIDEYAIEVIAAPTTEAEWLQIADFFSSLWNFHNCLGAMEGKHIAIKCTKGGWSLYFNYKFIWIDVGANDSASDGSDASDASDA